MDEENAGHVLFWAAHREIEGYGELLLPFRPWPPYAVDSPADEEEYVAPEGSARDWCLRNGHGIKACVAVRWRAGTGPIGVLIRGRISLDDTGWQTLLETGPRSKGSDGTMQAATTVSNTTPFAIVETDVVLPLMLVRIYNLHANEVSVDYYGSLWQK